MSRWWSPSASRPESTPRPVRPRVAYGRAKTTMTLALPKTGLDADAVGVLWLADIGIPREVYRRVGVQLPDGLFTPGYRVRLANDADDGAQTRVPLQ